MGWGAKNPHDFKLLTLALEGGGLETRLMIIRMDVKLWGGLLGGVMGSLLGLGWNGEAQARTQPRLGVVLVVDQFRSDYLMRFREEFRPLHAGLAGYRMLLERGAYFPLADHGLLQNMTGPGHAVVLSGSYPYRNQISTNIWYDRETRKNKYCVADDDFPLIGSQGVVSARVGVSPRTFNADTVGDELKNVDRTSRVVSVALKDRAAVLLGGKRADHALWFDDRNCEWVTSSFYAKQLPAPVLKRNLKLKREKDRRVSWGPFRDVAWCSKEGLQTPHAMEETLDLAGDMVDALSLGKGKDTDLLLVSLSSHDYYGHHHGPNDPFMKQMVLDEDRLLEDFFRRLSRQVPGGLGEVFVVLTGDHGVPPSALPSERIPSENIPEERMPRLVEEEMVRAFGKPKGGKWIEAAVEFQIYLNPESMRAAQIKPQDALKALRDRLLREPYIDQVWARDEILYERKVPAGEYGWVADHTLSRNSGDLIVVLKPFFYSDSYRITHMTQYSYDRFVPLVFFGKSFRPGVYRQIVHMVDIAPTLSSILGVLPPAQSEGRVLTEILR
jgi:predicted AlkP superfamily pyrophosphatase or phosphodiesterase